MDFFPTAFIRKAFADIIDLPHWDPKRHPRSNLLQRAVQFAPYSALTGYDEMIVEEARVTDHQIELEDEQKECINRLLDMLGKKAAAGLTSTVSITYFIPDIRKDGGHYETVTEGIRKIDSDRGIVTLCHNGQAGPGEEILLDRILYVQVLEA